MPHITLEQWQALIAVVEAGGYAQAAEKLHKSQSAISYAIQKMELILNVKVFEIQGRKAVLTPTGQMLYRRALGLVAQFTDLEHDAHRLSAGWEPVIQLAVEVLFPPPLLLHALRRFSEESPYTRIELIESVLGGTADALVSKQVDLAIAPQLPSGFLGDLLMRIQLLAIAHHEHPLHQLGRELTLHDLDAYRHIVVRDSGLNRDQKAVTVEVNQRWTVSQVATSIQAVAMGHGFAWLPEKQIESEMASGLLKPLPLHEGVRRELPLYLTLANPDFAGPGVKRLAQLIKEAVMD